MTRSGLTSVLLLGILVFLVLVASAGTVLAAAALAAAAYLLLLVVLGRERMAFSTMCAAFATAPIYRGLEFGVPATDLLLFVAFVLLVPDLISRKVHLPTLYLVPLVLLATATVNATLFAGNFLFGLRILVQWMVMIAILPMVMAVWDPSRARVRRLLWSYVGGHLVSILVALAEGPRENSRYDGLTIHANIFGFGGAMTLAILLFLWHEHRSGPARAVMVASGALALVSVVLSGGRAATLVVGILILLIPMVERSSIAAFLTAGLAGLGMAMLPVVLRIGGDGSSLGRLAGDGTTRHSDQLREGGLADGMDQFLQHPIIGSGFHSELGVVHNVYLEVAIALGVLGLLCYLLVLAVFAVPLFRRAHLHRLSYMSWVWVFVAPFAPSITDRTLWVPMSLAILPALYATRAGDNSSARESEGGTTWRAPAASRSTW